MQKPASIFPPGFHGYITKHQQCNNKTFLSVPITIELNPIQSFNLRFDPHQK